MKLNEILLVSDIDGTLIDSAYRVPERNREAIRRFLAKGGGFAIATGRSWESVALCVGDLPVNRPCILANGGVLYDMQRHQPVSVQPLPETAKEYTRRFMEKFPQAGIEVFTASDVWIVRENEVTRAHMQHEGIHFRTGNAEEIEDPWCKVLVAMKEQAEAIAFTESFAHRDVWFVASSDRYWEMLPANTDKGTGIKRLAEVCGCTLGQVAAIGDYYNDLEMLRAAGITAVPQNAPEEIRAMADVVVCSCNDGSVADFIAYLEKHYEGFEE